MSSSIFLTECPRDAMQGISQFIETDKKVAYIQCLLGVGFDTIDFGSFVSPKAIPQLKDTGEVLHRLDVSASKSKLLAIIANLRGAQEACKHSAIHCLGYPFSISETFQMRNTNIGMGDSIELVEKIRDEAFKHNKTLVIYLSMAFGNPYGDLWNAEIAVFWVQRLKELGIKRIALSDTIGIATSESIAYLFSHLIEYHPDIQFGAHFHTTPENWREKVNAAYNAGCCHFDGALYGYGGCPMAKDELTGNMPTEKLVSYFSDLNIPLSLDESQLELAKSMALSLFSN